MGRGNLGRSLARAFRAAGHLVTLVPGRTGFIKPPSLGVVFLAVPDHAVAQVAAGIASSKPARGLSFVHTSGALGLGALGALPDHPAGSFHPLQSFPAPRDPAAFRGITIAVDASTPAHSDTMILLHLSPAPQRVAVNRHLDRWVHGQLERALAGSRRRGDRGRQRAQSG